jgi:hypothetical protein
MHQHVLRAFGIYETRNRGESCRFPTSYHFQQLRCFDSDFVALHALHAEKVLCARDNRKRFPDTLPEHA